MLLKIVRISEKIAPFICKPNLYNFSCKYLANNQLNGALLFK